MNGTLNVKDATIYDLINLVARKVRGDTLRPAAKLCIQLIFRITSNSLIQFDAHTRKWRIIGSVGCPGSTALWFQRYSFPGAYSPTLSEILPHIERAGLLTVDVEVPWLHYAETLRR